MPKTAMTAQRAAQELRGAMAQQFKTGRELAELLNISQQSASRRINGQTPIGIHEIGPIAAWLKMPVTAFTGEPEGTDEE